MGDSFQKFSSKYSILPVATDGTALAPDFESKIDEFREFYSSNYQTLAAAEKAFRNLIQLLVSLADIEQPKVSSRLKNREECVEKFKYKYKNNIEKIGKDYNIQDHITDLIGVRVICLYETDIPLVEAIIKEHLLILEITDKTILLLNDIRAFGYKGLHFDLKLNQIRRTLPEYERFSDMQFELQVRSIVQDAWSEVDHKLKYKKQIPDNLQRRIIRLSALFELADQEFVAIRDETEELEKAAIHVNDKEDTIKLQNAETPLNSFSFLSILRRRHPNYNFEPAKIDGLVDEIMICKHGFTTIEFEKFVSEYYNDIWEYKQEMSAKNITMNPYTDVRHILFIADSQHFESMLNPKQAKSIIDWWDRTAET